MPRSRSKGLLATTAVYLVGLGLLFTPTQWVVVGYLWFVAIVILWCALAAVTVYRASRRVWLVATLAPLAALLIWMILVAHRWAAVGVVPF